MFTTILYWLVVAALIIWGLWSLIWSIIYIRNSENGNLLFYAIINAIVLLLGGIFALVYSNSHWLWFCLAGEFKNISVLNITLIAYIVLIAFQLIVGLMNKEKKAA